MSAVMSYSQVVEATIPRESWDETYFSLLSLKSHLQSLPGYQRIDVWAQSQEGSMKLVVVTNWEYPEQLEQWLKNGVTVDGILKLVEPAPISMTVDLFEEIA
ncbi:MAG: hypothetical protein P8074_13290 [Anaerolineales bacterium]|jgi:hypothetical protein